MPVSNALTESEISREIFSLNGRRILVTGASKGLGREIAIGLARFGARIALVARSKDGLTETAALIEEAGGATPIVRAVDLRDPDNIEETVESVVAELGGLDVLVNNAADDHDSPIEDTSLETWQRVIDLNSRSVWLLSKVAGPHLRASGGYGKVINVASVLGIVGVRDNTAYVMSKHAVIGLTKALALEWARKGVQVNALCPGFVVTEMTTHMHADEAGNRWVVKQTPMGRWGQTTDFVGSAVFLSSRASDFMTGQALLVDGGYTTQ
ncbi:2-deoxy-D-gluconate 3-dehydrogenase [Nocardia amikacinitolerans]|uniref:SDR family NAD(P)-dependent oxidoreductase n=1 Tax=Nocardia amikacinitolerans TaxID=756689 RepID=UPI0020A3CBD2|nr:SDR family oxidoreductase [Nocardia amikacinitolerans]MCP2297195.1 2-deoxy-D-gluconate 3-dehydrogenase [Nocardia amikacinitolerans]